MPENNLRPGVSTRAMDEITSSRVTATLRPRTARGSLAFPNVVVIDDTHPVREQMPLLEGARNLRPRTGTRSLPHVSDERAKGAIVEQFMAGAYSIADMATYPWVIRHANFGRTLDDDFPHMNRWFDTIRSWPAVVRGYALMEETRKNRKLTGDKTR
jgi:glutathione S-transferase